MQHAEDLDIIQERFLAGLKNLLPDEEPVSGPAPRLADLLDEVDYLIQRHALLPSPILAFLVAAWIAQTYCYAQFRYCGYLALRSATPRCGKTTLLRIISRIANGAPPITTNPRPAALFRSTRPVLLLDEVDQLRNADKENFGEVLAVLNTGYEQGGCVERTERAKGESFEVRSYNTYGPKALAGIEGLADTLADRSFQIQMERSATRMPRLNVRRMDELFEQLRGGFQDWTTHHHTHLIETYDGLPDELDSLKNFDDRFQDIAEPLVVLGSLADVERPEGPLVIPRLLKALEVAAGRREPSGRERQLLAFLEIAEERLDGASQVFVRSGDLIADCGGIEGLAFIETGRRLAGLLKHFDLFPAFNATKTERGYWITREWADTWRGRYGSGVETC